MRLYNDIYVGINRFFVMRTQLNSLSVGTFTYALSVTVTLLMSRDM